MLLSRPFQKSRLCLDATAAKCEELVTAGARLCASPREAAADADVVFTMVGAPSDVEAVTLGDDGVLAALRPGGGPGARRR